MALPICLVVEPDPFLALDLEIYCVENCYEIAGPYKTCKDAFRWLADHTPDLAIIGSEAQDGTCAPLADKLRRRRVPVIIHTADKRHAKSTPEFADAELLLKPFMPHQLTQAIATLLNAAKA
jgi:DNA-binding response OmpR family regulator